MISVKEDQLILDESGFKCKIKVSFCYSLVLSRFICSNFLKLVFRTTIRYLKAVSFQPEGPIVLP